MVRNITNYGRRTFASLSVYNYRLYVSGQVISQLGTWIFMVAQTWLVLQLTQSATMVGLLMAAQFLPTLLLGAYGGVLADRFNKRKLILATQSLLLLTALLMASLMYAGLLNVWMVFAMAFMAGMVAVVDNPARQAFVIEMVGSKHVTNAVSLNSIVNNTGRVVGPAIAAVLINKVGIEVCFLLNSFSFTGMLVCLALMRTKDLQPAERSAQMRGQLSAGWRYVRRTPELWTVLVMVTIMSIFSFNFPVILPLIATQVFQADAAGYALLSSALSVGAVIGGLMVAGRKHAPFINMVSSCALFGLSLLVAAAMPTLYTVALVLVAGGYASTGFISLANSTLQLRSKAAMRGRVMALWMVAVLGTAPIGGPLMGLFIEHTGPRMGLMVGGLAALLAGAYGLAYVRRSQAEPVTPVTTATA